MKKIFAALSLLLLSTSVFAWTIGPMNYQGRLLDGAGIPQTGTYTFTVNIYDTLTGGVLKFSENQNNITVTDGVYSFLVSTGVTNSGTWDINLWNTPSLYLEIVVSGQTLTPRHLLAAAPFAFQANLALTTNNALALGGVSATQYQNTLAAICVSGKGKWLELVGKCLGVGSSFPGPSRVNWNTLTASSDFSNLDLSRADISGIDFYGANLQKTFFNQTTYATNGLGFTDLTNSHWDSAIATDTVAAYASPRYVNSAYFTNMDMSKWNLNLDTLSAANNMSAANLSACPASLPTHGTTWECRLMYPAGTKYFLVGLLVNLSSNSAAASIKNGVSVLDLDVNALNGATLNGASFVGNLVTQNLVGASLPGTDFSYAMLRDISISGALDSAIFSHSKFQRVTIQTPGDYIRGSYINAEFDSVVFNTTAVADFTKATFHNVLFAFDISNSNFTSAILDNVVVAGQVGYSTFDATRFYNGFSVGKFLLYAPQPKDLFFSGGILSGDFSNVTFTGTITFKNMMFNHLVLTSATIPLMDTTAPHDDLKTVTWGADVTCPNGQHVTDGCDIGTRM